MLYRMVGLILLYIDGAGFQRLKLYCAALLELLLILLYIDGTSSMRLKV